MIIENRLHFVWTFVARHAVKVIVVLLLVYFAYHSVHGERGLFAWLDTSRELDAKRAELAQMREDRQRLENRVDALGVDNLNRDLLEEELYKLGYVKRDELVVLPPQD